ncbi:TolC family outer membrane protein [Ramlibacter sp. AN1133]|uniref:TolC family outer membrane protein n=1 Tax=Ramlibacter sp. AN1133 TaxID=3133429 RepID=UPI0030BB5A2D
MCAGLASTALAAPLDLAQAWQAALANDAQLRAARATAQANRERVPQAEAQLKPQVNLNMQRSRNELRSESAGLLGEPVQQHLFYGAGTDSLTLRQPLYRPQLTAQLRQARALAANGDALFEEEQQKLVMRLTQSYLEALQAEEQLRLVGVQRVAYLAQLDAARKGFAGGSGTRTDIDEAQARLDLNTAQELEARQSVDFARRQLAVMVGQPVTELVALDPARLPLAVPEPARLEDWVARAETASPEVRAAAANLQAARHEVERVRAGHLPTLDAVAQLSRSDSDNPTRVDTRYTQKTIGVQLNVPLYQGGLVQSQIRQALADVERYESVLEGLKQDLSSRVHREFRGVTEGIARVRALEQAVRSSEQLALSSRRSQQGGSRTLVDVLNAEQQLGTARRDLAQARFTYLLSIVRLRALAGELTEGSIGEVNRWLVGGAPGLDPPLADARPAAESGLRLRGSEALRR